MTKLLTPALDGDTSDVPFAITNRRLIPALIPRQDFSNIERQQRGLHTQGMHGMRTSEQFEDAIPNMHAHLDRYLAQ